MRKFKLINIRGQEWLMNNKESFFQNPSGLGVRRKIESIAAGLDWIETDNQVEQQTVSGEIVLKGYQKYLDFVRFCTAAPLTLCYMPMDKWYYRTCKVEILEKTEINLGNHWLICPVDFLCSSAWYDKITASKTQLDEDSGKIYPYRYPYTYAETSAGSAEINNTAVIASPSRLHIVGPVTNPSWALMQSGSIIVSGKVFAEIPEGHKLVVDSSPSHMEIAQYSNDNQYIQNLYAASDFATARFLYIPPGQSKITFAHEGAGIINAWIEVRQIATTV